MRSKHNTQKPSDLLLKTNLMKMVTQFYICEMAKEYINTIINVELYIEKNVVCLWRWAWKGLLLVSSCEMVEIRLPEIRWKVIVTPDVGGWVWLIPHGELRGRVVFEVCVFCVFLHSSLFS